MNISWIFLTNDLLLTGSVINQLFRSTLRQTVKALTFVNLFYVDKSIELPDKKVRNVNRNVLQISIAN